MARARGRLLLLLLAFLAAVGATEAARHDAPAPRSSSISAAPEYPPLPRLPNQHHRGVHAAGPALPPAALPLSPDIMPVLPSPAEDGAAAPAPGEEEPTIPSSPSPPNPDALEPDSAFAPFGSAAPAVAKQSHAAPRAAPASAFPLLGLLLAMSWLLLVA